MVVFINPTPYNLTNFYFGFGEKNTENKNTT